MKHQHRPTPAIPMPGLLARPATWLLVMFALLAPFFVKIPVGLRRNAVIAPLGDQLHIVLLAGITLMLYWRGPLTGRLGPTAAVAAAIGGSIEFLQLLVGRAALFHDFVLDLIGIGLVVGWILWRGHGRKAGKWLLLALALSIPAQLYWLPGRIAASLRMRELFPVIADFERGRDRWVWHTVNGGEMAVVAADDTDPGATRHLVLTGAPPDDWPGAHVRRFPHHWADRRRLVFSARAVGGDTVRFGVRLEDFEGGREDRYTASIFTADRRWRDYAVELTGLQFVDGGGAIDLTDVDLIEFYLPHPAQAETLAIDDIRLE